MRDLKNSFVENAREKSLEAAAWLFVGLVITTFVAIMAAALTAIARL